MQIQHEFPLLHYNTFGITAKAKQFVSISSLNELRSVFLEYPNEPKFILGGGSNMLLTQDIEALVIHINLKGKEVLSETKDSVIVRGMAGENWHEFVIWTLENKYGGLENMSLIPGNVGTTPVQNIGAYGKEIKDNFVSCVAFNRHTLELKTFSNSECEFGYRESIFKNKEKDNYIIISVDFCLQKAPHQVHTAYGDIQSELAKQQITNPSIQDVSKAVIAIRQSKLPDPKELGNSGSFFKNPVVLKSDFAAIHKKFPEMRYFDVSPTEVKVPAGWLIEQCGFKGKRFGDAGIHKNQALVLVNYGQATGKEIAELAQRIQAKVFETFGIRIEAEVNII
ncbi:MAG: UDP-N-acetylmuramate dehydrogenase [Flavobacterium sp.]|nr:UDP-N-acetylmuramate dehydrogenase [Flavobacterium sp.]